MKQIRRIFMGKHGSVSVCPLKCGDAGECGCGTCAIFGHSGTGPSGHCYMPSNNCHKGCAYGEPA